MDLSTAPEAFLNSTNRHNRRSCLRRVAAAAAALVFSVSLTIPSFADLLTDVPTLDLPAASIGTASGGGTGNSSGAVIIAPPDSGNTSAIGGGSSSGVSVSDSEIIITDSPLIEGGSGSSTAGSSGNSGISAGQAPVTSGNSSIGGAPGSGSADTSAASSAPEVRSSDTTTGKAPEAVNTASTEAPAAPPEEKPVSAAVTGPSSTAGGAGSIYANSAVTRVNLDFSLITPTHSKGVMNVARASVKQTDGSWQNFDYKDNIHFAFYKMKESRTDSNGVNWYVASVKARRFGDTYSDDGEMKTELWLNASDCIVRNTIDISTTNPKRIAIVKAALASLGKQYVYGGNGPDAYDCSGLVKYVYKEAGFSLPRTSNQLLQLDGQITAAELRPGDLMVRAGHCGIYIGNGIFVHASDSSVGVVAEYLSVYNLSNKFTNYVNVAGD